MPLAAFAGRETVAPEEDANMDESQTTPTAPDSAIDALRGLSTSDRLLGLYGYEIGRAHV